MISFHRGASDDSGWALPALLVFITLSASLLRIGFTSTSDTIHLLQDIAHALRIRTLLLEDISHQLPRMSGCKTIASESHSSLQKSAHTVCSATPVPFRSLPLLPHGATNFEFDYNLLLANPTPCPGRLELLRFVLGAAAKSNSTCVLSSYSGNSLSLKSNLSALQVTLFGGSRIALLASVGSLSVRDRITVSGPTIVFGGGDVTIGEVATSNTRGVKVTIISASGAIKINSIGPRVSPLLLARGDMHAPPAALSGPYPLPPQLKTRRIIGISTLAATNADAG